MPPKFTNVDEYIELFPENVKEMLLQLRKLIKENAPLADESISYSIPSYKLNGKPLVYFAGYATHIGLYVTPSSHEKFALELSGYKKGKGSVQFPLDSPLPLDLISEMIDYRLNEIESADSLKKDLA